MPESTTTHANRHRVELLQAAVDALLAQKAHKYLVGAEVFQNPQTTARWAGDQPIRKTL